MQQLTNPSPCIGLVTTGSVQAQVQEMSEMRDTELVVMEHELNMSARDLMFSRCQVRTHVRVTLQQAHVLRGCNCVIC